MLVNGSEWAVVRERQDIEALMQAEKLRGGSADERRPRLPRRGTELALGPIGRPPAREAPGRRCSSASNSD